MALNFSRNKLREAQLAIMDLWGIHNTQKHDKYLNLPIIIKKSRRWAFGEIKQRLCKKLQNLKELILSQ